MQSPQDLFRVGKEIVKELLKQRVEEKPFQGPCKGDLIRPFDQLGIVAGTDREGRYFLL